MADFLGARPDRLAVPEVRTIRKISATLGAVRQAKGAVARSALVTRNAGLTQRLAGGRTARPSPALFVGAATRAARAARARVLATLTSSRTVCGCRRGRQALQARRLIAARIARTAVAHRSRAAARLRRTSAARRRPAGTATAARAASAVAATTTSGRQTPQDHHAYDFEAVHGGTNSKAYAARQSRVFTAFSWSQAAFY